MAVRAFVFVKGHAVDGASVLICWVERAGMCGSCADYHADDCPRLWRARSERPDRTGAGAAYGHLWGTVQVVIGAELGALIAFGLARVLGQDVLAGGLFGDRVMPVCSARKTALNKLTVLRAAYAFVSFTFDQLRGRSQPPPPLALRARGTLARLRSGRARALPISVGGGFQR